MPALRCRIVVQKAIPNACRLPPLRVEVREGAGLLRRRYIRQLRGDRSSGGARLFRPRYVHEYDNQPATGYLGAFLDHFPAAFFPPFAESLARIGSLAQSCEEPLQRPAEDPEFAVEARQDVPLLFKVQCSKFNPDSAVNSN